MRNAKEVRTKKSEEITFPYTYDKGSVVVKIYHQKSHGCDSFTVAYWQDGVRKRPAFPTFEKALAEAKVVALRLGSQNADVLTLTSADRALYLRSKELAAVIGMPLEVIVSQMVAVKQVLKDVPPLVAAEYYKKTHPTELPLKMVKDVIEEMLISKRGDVLSEGYLRHLRYDLEKFNESFACTISAVTGEQIDTWLRGLGVSPRTRNNLRCSLHTLFNYAKSRKYLPKDHDELEGVSRAKDRDGEIEIFKPAELVEVLAHAPGEIVAFIAIGAFAGIRHAEIQRLHWEDIRVEDELIEVRAQTASRRTIPITPNLKEWLLQYRKQSGPVCGYTNVAFALHKVTKGINETRRQAWIAAGGNPVQEEKKSKTATKRLRQKGDVPPGAEHAKVEGWTAFAWKHNALRHSFISYRVADVQDVAKVSLEAGNSPQMVFKHYRELVRPVDAKTWFGVVPKTVVEAKERAEATARPANVVALTKEAA
jgi:integrase